jgi:hypothetical protein
VKVLLSDKSVVTLQFVRSYSRPGEHGTICIMRRFSDDATQAPEAVQTQARCDPGDKYNKALGKAKALARACRTLLPNAADRPHRLRIWAKFYQCLHTPDIRVLSGAPRYRAPVEMKSVIMTFAQDRLVDVRTVTTPSAALRQ